MKKHKNLCLILMIASDVLFDACGSYYTKPIIEIASLICEDIVTGSNDGECDEE